MICCGFGHRLLNRNIAYSLRETLSRLITSVGVDVFLTGGMGEFDNEFASCVRSLKREHEEIRLILVKPYITKDMLTNKEYYEASYDEIIIPEQASLAHRKAAISVRNKWMIDKSDYVISAVCRDYGGAYDTIKYAARINKKIIKIC